MHRMTAGEGGAQAARERIIRLLARCERTTEDLARELGVTANAVRAQLALLRREGLIEERGQVRGARRPSTLFGLRPGAEVRFSRAYPLALARLVEAASERLRPAAFMELLRAMGRRMAATVPPAAGNAESRVRAARSLLEDLGSRVEVSKRGGTYILRGDSCPLGEAVIADRRTCVSVSTMLQGVTGLSVSECCEHGDHPRCGFAIEIPAAMRARRRRPGGSAGERPQ